jgi:integral membrane sensor domain MASE1
MYRPGERDWPAALVTAGLGAGVVTSLAVVQGQHPLVALGITLFAAVMAVVVDELRPS